MTVSSLNIRSKFVKKYYGVNRLTKEVYFIDPEELFPFDPPYQPIYGPGEQNDETEVGMQSYMQILPSIALYGFKYAIEVTKSHKVLNGDFRTFAARELGLKIPVVYHRIQEGRTIILYILIRRMRGLLKKQSLFFRRFKNPNFHHGEVPLLCRFQEPLFDSIYPPRTDVSPQKRPKPSLKQKVATIIDYYRGKEVV